MSQNLSTPLYCVCSTLSPETDEVLGQLVPSLARVEQAQGYGMSLSVSRSSFLVARQDDDDEVDDLDDDYDEEDEEDWEDEDDEDWDDEDEEDEDWDDEDEDDDWNEEDEDESD